MSIELTTANFKTEVTDSSMPVVIKAFASWCGPCIQMTPIFKEVEKEFLNKVKFLELNVDQARDLAINFGITSIPTIIFIKDGKIVSKETGYMDAKTLTSTISQFIKQA